MADNTTDQERRIRKRRARRIAPPWRVGFAAVALLAFLPSAARAATTGLVAHWTFDEGSGTTANDSSGNGHTGTLLNGPTWTAGIIGGALQFDGVDDYVEVPDSPALRAARPMTVAGWIKRDALGENDVILRKRGDGNRGWWFTVNAGNKVFFTFGNVADTFSSGTVDAAGWHHVAATVSASGAVAFYIDGAPAGTATIGGPQTTTQPLRMGPYTQGNGSITGYSDSTLDDLRVYNRALSPAEIQALIPPLPPEASDDGYGVAVDGSLTVPAPGVLGNDTDINGGALTAVKVTDPANGTVTFNADGSFTYTPNAAFNGVDSFTYKANDGGLDSNVATVTIQVGAVTAGLVAHWTFDDGSGTTAADASGNGHDGTLVNGPMWTAGIIGGALRFDDVDDVVQVGSPNVPVPWTAAVWVKRQPSSRPSTRLLHSVPDSLKLEQYNNTKKVGFTRDSVGDYTFNYAAPSGTWVHLAYVASAAGTSLYVNGTLVGTRPETITLPMSEISHAAEPVSATLDDLRVYNRALSAAEIRVIGNRPPTAADETYAFAVNTPLTVPAPGVLANDSDAEGDSFSAELVTPPAQGALVFSPDGSFTYTPPADYAGPPETFIYRLRDAQNRYSNTATVTLNGPPPTLTGVTPDRGDKDTRVSLTLSGNNLPAWTGEAVGWPTVTFDGVNDRMNVPSSALINSPNITLELWLYATSGGRVALKRNGRAFLYEQFELKVLPDGRVGWGLASAGGTQVGVSTMGSVFNEWVHIAATYDGTTLRIYRNGALEEEKVAGFPIKTHTEELVLGGDPWWDNDYLGGRLSEVRFWKVARTQAEIQATMNTALVSGHADLVFRYDFAGGGPNFIDRTGNGHTATPRSGAPAFGGFRQSSPVLVRLKKGAVAAYATGTLTSTLTALTCGVNLTGLAPDVYDVELLMDGAVAASLPGAFTVVDPTTHVQDLAGNALDGEYPGALPDVGGHGLPSGDGAAGGDFVATFTINLAPTATDQAVATNEDAPLAGLLTATDPTNDPLTYSLVANGTKGTAIITDPATGAFIYTPNADENGSDSFTFKANDGTTDSNVATVTVTINSVNDPPLAVADAYAVNEDNALNGASVLGNDSDLHGGAPSENNVPLTAQLAAGPAHAAAFTFNADGTFSYTPQADYNGLDGFTYTATDSLGGVSAATAVSITVNPVNDVPTVAIGGGSFPLTVDPGDTINFLSTVSDPDIGDTHTYLWDFGDGTASSAQNPAHAFGAMGPYWVTVTVTDGGGLSGQDTVLVNVTGIIKRSDLKVTRALYRLAFGRKLSGGVAEVDRFSFSGQVDKTALQAAGVDLANLLATSASASLDGVEVGLGAPTAVGTGAVSWRTARGVVPGFRLSLNPRRGTFRVSVSGVDLAGAMSPAASENAAGIIKRAVTATAGLKIGPWTGTLLLGMQYSSRRVNTTGIGRFRYGRPGYDLPGGLFFVDRARLLQSSRGGMRQKVFVTVCFRPMAGTDYDPLNGTGAMVALGAFQETAGDGTVGGKEFTRNAAGTILTYRRPRRDVDGTPIAAQGVRTVRFLKSRWKAAITTNWMSAAVGASPFGVDPVLDAAADPRAAVPFLVRLDVNGVGGQATINLPRVGTRFQQ